MAKKDRKKQRQENKELRKISREMGSAMDVKPAQKPSTGSPVSRALESTKKVAETLNTLDGVYLGQSKGSPISKPSSKLPPTPKDSTVGEEVNTGQTKVSKTPKEKPREKRPTGIEVVRNQSNKEALAKELGKKESGNVAAPPPDSDNLAYNEDELQRIKEEEEVRKDMEYHEVPSSGDAESVKIIDEAINGKKTEAPIDINKPLNDEAGELADQENAFQKVFNKGKDVINNGVSAVGELFDGESPDSKITKEQITAAGEDVINNLVNSGFQGEDAEANLKMLGEIAKRQKTAKREPAIIEQLGYKDYFPTGQQPIAVGSYSRKTLGSGNIYAASGLTVPMAIVDARSRAISAEAKAQAKKVSKLLEQSWAVPAQYQPRMDSLARDYFEKYGKAVNWDYSLLTDPTSAIARKFKEEGVRLSLFEKQVNDIETRADKILKQSIGKDSSAIDVPKEVLDAIYQWKEGMTDLEGLMNNKKFGEITTLLKSYDNMTYYAQQQATAVKGQMDKFLIKDADITSSEQAASINDALETITKGADSDNMAYAYRKLIDPTRLRAMAEGIYQTHVFNPDITLEMTEDYLAAQFGSQIDVETFKNSHGNLKRAKFGYEKQKDRKHFESLGNNYIKNQDAFISAASSGKNLSTIQGMGAGLNNLKTGDNVIGRTTYQKSVPTNVIAGDMMMKTSTAAQADGKPKWIPLGEYKSYIQTIAQDERDETQKAILGIDETQTISAKTNAILHTYATKDGDILEYNKGASSEDYQPAIIEEFSSFQAAEELEGKYLVVYDDGGKVEKHIRISDGTHTADATKVKAFKKKNPDAQEAENIKVTKDIPLTGRTPVNFDVKGRSLFIEVNQEGTEVSGIPEAEAEQEINYSDL